MSIERFGTEYYRTGTILSVPERYIPTDQLLHLCAPPGSPSRGAIATIIDEESRRFRASAASARTLPSRATRPPISGEAFIREQIDLARRDDR
jgi:hypothetical protein